MVVSKAFSPNPSLQPRAFVTLGCLIKHDYNYDDALLFQTLLSLVDALQNLNIERDFDLAVSIVMCLTQIVPIVPSESKLLKPMFWVAMSLLQIANVELFPSGLALLEVVLRTVCELPANCSSLVIEADWGLSLSFFLSFFHSSIQEGSFLPSPPLRCF